jgi:chitin disaccharide deacetylase
VKGEIGSSHGDAPTGPAEAGPGPRALIVNADDFGRNQAINAGVIIAHEQGIVTSASLMVRYPAAGEAAEYGREHSALGVGLHVDLYEWEYQGDSWVEIYEIVPVTDAGAVAAEVERQLGRFRELMQREPTHLDSHQHVHVVEPAVASVLSQAAARLGLPLRRVSEEISYSGDFYGQTKQGLPVEGAISVERLVEIVRSLPEGITELGCHPALGDAVDSVYRTERQRELEALCDPCVRAAIDEEGIVLRSFQAAVTPERRP